MHDSKLMGYDLSTKNKNTLQQITTNGKQVLLNQPLVIYYNLFNQSAHDILLNFDIEGGQFVLLEFDKDLNKGAKLMERRGENILAAIFISKDRIAMLDTNREILVGSFDGQNSKKWPIIRKGLNKIEMIFPAPLGKILVQGDDCLFMYDLSAKKVLHELSITDVKRVQWTPTFSHAAIFTKN